MRNQFLFPSLILGICLLAGLVIAGNYFYQAQKSERFVTVKGLAEKEVTADKGSWLVQTEYAGSRIEEVRTKADSQLKTIKSFLSEKGFGEDEIKVVEFNIRHNYYANNALPYVASIQVSLFTDKVDLLDKISGNVDELIDRGIQLSGDRWTMRPRYFFTHINEIKPELLAGATRAAFRSAEEFAGNSGAKVGSIRRAYQGIITLIPASRISESEEFHKEKIARVVSTIDYYIEE